MNQLELHEKIREFVEKGFKSVDFAYLKNELFVNDDSKKYFYSRIDKTWIKPLQQAGVFKIFNEKATDPNTIVYRMPELGYLINITDEAPSEVVDVIEHTKIYKENFNPEVIERFIWISTKLPLDQLKRVVAKMEADKWVELMARFRKSGYEFAPVVTTLLKDTDNKKALIQLAKSIIIIRDEKSEQHYDSIFYVSDLSASGIFESLKEIKDEIEIKEITTYLLNQFSNAVKIHGSKYNSGESPFEYDDPFSLHDQSLFNMEIGGKNAFSYHLDEKNLIALIILMFRKIKGGNVQDIWNILNGLPSCEIAWKSQLVFLVTYKNLFTKELSEKINSLFEYGNDYGAIDYGPEYKEAVGMVFSDWDIKEQKEYITKAIEFFKKQVAEHPDQSWHLRNVTQLFSIIYKSVSNPDIKEILSNSIKDDFDSKLDESYNPEPLYKRGTFGSVNHKTPFDISKLPVSEIFNKLKTDWTPEKINEEFKDDDFLSPRSPEGLGDALKENLKVRFDDYIACMLSESEYKDIHPHYVSALLRTFEDLFRDENKKWSIEEIDSILEVLTNLKSQGVVDGDLSEKDNSWLGTWLTVKRSMADVLIYIIEPKGKELRQAVHAKNKNDIFGLLQYLFKTPESPNAKHEEPDYGDPFHVAINSVRGRVYQGFIVYTENDGKTLSSETKEFFQNALNDPSTAVRFVIGYYLPSIYYRDIKFVKGLFPKIFPNDLSDKMASWEGYLNQSLYKELYAELKEYYLWSMDVTPPERKYTKEIDEVLSAHIALDFVHFQESHKTGLVWDFLKRKNTKQIEEFISFIGRSYINRDSATKKSLDELPGGFDKFMNFWDWVIEQELSPEAYSGFGFWVNDEIIDSKILIDKINRTFEVSKGAIEWEHKLEKSLVKFAQTDSEKTLDLIKSYLLEKNDNGGYVLNTKRRYPIFSIDNEIKRSLEIIYENPELKGKVYELINLLIENGGQVFWSLESILSE